MPDEYEITAITVPKTREHAIALAQAWGHRLSHSNECWVEQPEGGQRFLVDMAARADAAEVDRMVALASVLPSEKDEAAQVTVDEIRELRAYIMGDSFALAHIDSFMAKTKVLAHTEDED
jgi:hypothetical protein